MYSHRTVSLQFLGIDVAFVCNNTYYFKACLSSVGTPVGGVLQAPGP